MGELGIYLSVIYASRNSGVVKYAELTYTEHVIENVTYYENDYTFRKMLLQDEIWSPRLPRARAHLIFSL